MTEIVKRKAILFVRVEPFEIYFCGEGAYKFRLETLEIYCQQNNIEPIGFHWIIGQYQSFDTDFFPCMKQNYFGIVSQADLLIMHDSHELSGGIITAVNLIPMINKLGLEVVFIKDFAIKIGRY